MSKSEFKVDPAGQITQETVEFRFGGNDVVRQVSDDFAGLELNDECKNCLEGRLRIGRHPSVGRGIANFGKVLKVICICLFVYLTLSSFVLAANARFTHQKQMIWVHHIILSMFILSGWTVGWGLARKTLRYRCELCGESISKKEFLARPNKRIAANCNAAVPD